MADRRQGFTLIELLVVMAIVALLMGIGTAGYGLARRQARESAAKADIERFRLALEEFRVEFGAYPADGDSFESVLEAMTAEQRAALVHHVDRVQLVDPWGNPYRYESIDRFRYRVWSTGPDLKKKDDDITPSKVGY